MRRPGRGGLAVLAVLALVSLAHAAEFRAPVVAQTRSDGGAPRATGTIPAIGAVAGELRFFEGPTPMPRDAAMNFDKSFPFAEARFMYWELRLSHPAPGRATSFTIEEVWHGPGIVHRASRTFTLQPEWTSSVFYGSARLVETRSVDTAGPVYSPEECERQRRLAGPFAPEPPACSQTRPSGVATWARGNYQVNLLVDQQVVATGSFQMR